MARKPLLLDLCCGAGGAGMGYARAGFQVVGVDLAPQPRYPFPFIQGDAVEFVRWHGHRFDAHHGSPPCQSHSALTKGTNKGRSYPDIIEALRHEMGRHGKPYVLENVMPAPIRRDVMLCGEMFGLAVIRHRKFELNGWQAQTPAHVKHRGRVAGMRHGEWFTGPYFAVYGDGGGKGTVAQWQKAMGIDWTDVRVELAEAIPPAYTEFLGRQLIKEM